MIVYQLNYSPQDSSDFFMTHIYLNHLFIFTEIIGARIWFVRLWLVITDYPIFFVIKSVEINRREKNVNFAALDIWSDNFIIMDLFTFEICDMHPKTVSR